MIWAVVSEGDAYIVGALVSGVVALVGYAIARRNTREHDANAQRLERMETKIDTVVGGVNDTKVWQVEHEALHQANAAAARRAALRVVSGP